MPRPIEITPMPFDDFLVMDHRLGWKHEYLEGAAWLSPALVLARFELRLGDFTPPAKPPGETYQIRHVEVADKRQLIGLLVDVFDTSIEFVDWSEAAFHENAHNSIASFFVNHGSSGDHLVGYPEYSFVAITARQVVAALQVRRHRRGPMIEPVMVHPTHQRRGLGRALLAATVRSMQESGQEILHSRCYLGNPASYTWHTKCGFREVESFSAANHRAIHFRQRAKHFEHVGDSEQSQQMARQADYWAAIVKEWEDSPEKWLASSY